jgi:hypothetical protein
MHTGLTSLKVFQRNGGQLGCLSLGVQPMPILNQVQQLENTFARNIPKSPSAGNEPFGNGPS